MGTFVYCGQAVLTAKARKALKAAVTEMAEDFVGQAKAATPVDTGTLRDSIHVAGVSGQGSNADLGSYTATVRTGGVGYDVYVHEGTSRGVPAFKYMEGPLLENADRYREFLAAKARDEF